MEELRTCGLCHARHPAEELYPFDSLELCGTCLNERTVLCSSCGERIWAHDNAGSESVPLCQSCLDDHYTHCCGCGALLRESQACYEDWDEYDESPYCPDCFDSRREVPIRDYYYKPEPLFYGEGPRYFGVELEIDGGGEDRSNASALLNLVNRNGEYLYIKHDGSLDDGLDLV